MFGINVHFLINANFPLDTFLLNTLPLDTFPSDTFPLETFPLDSFPSDTFPLDTIPSETLLSDTFSLDIFPSDTFPSDAHFLINVHFSNFSQRRLQRNSWIASENIKSESKPPKRSTSADSSKKPRISCDVSNLKVVGTKTNFNPMNTRASTPESSEMSTTSKVQIKKPLLKSQECSLKSEQPSKSRLSRSRQILKELQRQVKKNEGYPTILKISNYFSLYQG